MRQTDRERTREPNREHELRESQPSHRRYRDSEYRDEEDEARGGRERWRSAPRGPEYGSRSSMSEGRGRVRGGYDESEMYGADGGVSGDRWSAETGQESFGRSGENYRANQYADEEFGGRDYRGEYGREFGREYQRDSGQQYGRDYGQDFGTDYERGGPTEGYGGGRGQFGDRRDQWDRSFRGRSGFGGWNSGLSRGRYEAGYDGGARGFKGGYEIGEDGGSWSGVNRSSPRGTESERWRGRGAVQHGRFSGVGPKGYKRSDDRINEDVQETLMRDPEIDASDIEVDVNNGEVTLTGSVPTKHQKRLAEDVVEDLSGVRDVQNNLRVSNNRSTSQADGSGHTRSSSGSAEPARTSSGSTHGAATQNTGTSGEATAGHRSTSASGSSSTGETDTRRERTGSKA
jgi:hypothetical protein